MPGGGVAEAADGIVAPGVMPDLRMRIAGIGRHGHWGGFLGHAVNLDLTVLFAGNRGPEQESKTTEKQRFHLAMNGNDHPTS